MAEIINFKEEYYRRRISPERTACGIIQEREFISLLEDWVKTDPKFETIITTENLNHGNNNGNSSN